jgi:hypothetical protein
MKIEDIKHIINKIENNFNVDEWLINDIYVWPLIRIDNYMRLSFKSLKSKPLNTKSLNFFTKLLFSKLIRMWQKVIDYKLNDNFEKTDVLFLSDGISKSKINDKWYDKYFDTLKIDFEKLKIKSTRLELAHNFYTPRYSKSIFIQTELDNIIIINAIKNKFFRGAKVDFKLNGYDIFCDDAFVKSNLLKIPNKVELLTRIRKLSEFKKYYIKKLNILKPKVAFLTNYYSDEQISFILACKEFNIPTIDIQHGVQGHLHLAYGSWLKLPESSYKIFPNYFWVWSNSEKNNIESWVKSKCDINVLVGGNPFLDLWKDDSSDIVKKHDFIFNNSIRNELPRILLTISPSTDELLDETWAVLSKTQYKYDWHIRLHPSMLNEIEKFKKKLHKKGILNFEISNSTKLPLYTILRNVDIHITAQSSCVIDSESYGIFSIITSDYGKSLYSDSISNGNAKYCNSYSEILKNIKIVLNASTYTSTLKVNYSNKELALRYIVNKYKL